MLKKIVLAVIVLLILIGLGCWIYLAYPRPEAPTSTPEAVILDPMNAIYMIEGQEVVLVNGQAEKEMVPGSAIRVMTIAWGQVAKSDLNNDGFDDAALVLMQNSGGSGSFFYVVAALGSENGKAVGTNGILLGDRIVPENISISGKEILVDYLDRVTGEPMTAQPSVQASKWFAVEENVLKEVSK
jgi:hypothetical protein